MSKQMAMLGPLFCALALTARGQAPNLDEGRELWRGIVQGHELRVCQIPRSSTALIPLRFVLEAVEAPAESHGSGTVHHSGATCPDCAKDAVPDVPEVASALQAFDHAEFTAVAGAEATLAYAGRRSSLNFWGDRQAEVRETFRTPGSYRLLFASDTNPDLRIVIPIEVKPFRYLDFGSEFAFFAGGCLLLGGIFAGVILWLRRRTPTAELQTRA